MSDQRKINTMLEALLTERGLRLVEVKNWLEMYHPSPPGDLKLAGYRPVVEDGKFVTNDSGHYLYRENNPILDYRVEKIDE